MATSTNSRNLLLSTAASRTVTNQKTVVLSAPVTVFLYTSAGTLSDSTATIAITATRQNTTEPIVWTNNGGITLYTAATGGTAVLTPDTRTGTTVTAYVRASDFNTLNLNSLLVTATITDVDVFSSSLAITKLQPGSAGVAGDTAVFAYQVISGASLPAAPSITQGTVPTAGAAVTGTTWYLQPKATLAAEEWMFQVSGTRTAAGVYTWQTQGYLSTFKVGKLEALTTDTGNLTVSATGSIKTAASVYGQAGAFFIGNDGGTTKFSIGDKLLYSGTTFSLPGITIGSTGAISGIGTGNGTIINNDSVRPGGVNLVGNSGFLRNNASLPTNWGIYNNSGITVTNSVQTGGMFGQNYVRVTAGASTPTTLGIYVAQSTSDSVKSWEPAQTYCVSFWARASAGGLGKKMYGLYSNMGFTGGVELENPVLTSSWQRYVFRGIPVNNSFTANGELYISVEVQGTTTPLPSGSVIDICCPKVELGTQPSSWTPSPQDTMNINLEPSITAKLSKSSADILTGPITINTTGGIVAGTLTWDSTGTRTGGQGVAVTPKGIVGHNGVKTTFAVDATTGDATFAGTLAGNTVTANSILVTGRGAALNDDPACQDQSAWTGWSGNPVATVTAISDGKVGNWVLRASTSSRSISAKLIPADPGKTYRLSAWVRRVNSNGVFYLRTVDYGPTETSTAGGLERPYTGLEAITPPNAVWTRYSTQFTVPTGRAFVSPHIILAWGGTTGYMEAQDIRIEEAASADLIVDGAVTANKISSDFILANRQVIVGSSPAISGTTMTGSGAVINSTGTFALGGTTSNIVGTGSAVYVNGEVIATSNLVQGAVNTVVNAKTASTVTITHPDSPDFLNNITHFGTALTTASIVVPSGNAVLIAFTWDYTQTGGSGAQVFVRIRRSGGTEVYKTRRATTGTGTIGSQIPVGAVYVDSPPAGTYTYYLEFELKPYISQVLVNYAEISLLLFKKPS